MAVLGWLIWFSDFIEHHIGAITAIIAGAAVFQWRETRLTAERQLRAYVLNSTATLLDGTTLDPKPHIDRTDQPAVVVEIKNYGGTPAKRVVHYGKMQVALASDEDSMVFPAPLKTLSPSVIGPQATSTKAIWLDRALSTQEKAGIQNGTYAIFIYGRVEYRDAFGEKRWSTYRLKYTNMVWPPYNKGTASMSFCDGGNDAD
jgi:hypothetical protein